MTSNPQLDLLLVNPGQPERCFQALAQTFTAIEPPVWAGLIAACARREGYAVHLLDAHAEQLDPDGVAARIEELRPLLTAVVVYGHNPSASTQVMPAAGAICRAVKTRNPEHRLILVGGHVAALPERTLREEAVDFVCAGEGPVTILELVAALRSSKRPDYSRVRGLRYWRDGVPQSTPAAPLVMDLDERMPDVAWDLMPMPRYRAHNWHCFGRLHERQPYAALYTTLGCPFRCTFCCIQAPFRSGEQALGFAPRVNSYRFWHPDTVVAQIDRLVTRYGVRNIKIADEMFVLNRRHVLAICDRLIERNYDLNLWAYARVDTVRCDEVIGKLKRAGFNWLAFGIESASEQVRAEVQKGFAQELIAQTIDKVRREGIHVVGNYVFGLPDDDAERLRMTLDLAMDLRTEWANFYCAMAYPGSQLYVQAQRERWPLPASWSGYSQYAKEAYPLPTRSLSSGSVLRFRDEAFRRYFSDPGYQATIGARFGPDAVAHVEDMLSYRLERDHAPEAQPGEHVGALSSG